MLLAPKWQHAWREGATVMFAQQTIRGVVFEAGNDQPMRHVVASDVCDDTAGQTPERGTGTISFHLLQRRP